MIKKIVMFLLIFTIQLMGEKEIKFFSHKDFNNCGIRNGKIQYIKGIGYGIIFHYKDIQLDENVDLFLNFNQKQIVVDETGNYLLKQANIYFNPNFKFCDSYIAGFIKPENKLIVAVQPNKFLSNFTDLGSFAIDFFIYPVLFNSKTTLLKKGDFLDNRFYGIHLLEENKRIKIIFSNLFYNEKGEAYTCELLSRNSLQLNQWQHIGVIFDRTKGKISLLIKGELDSEKITSSEQASDIPHFSQLDGSDLVLFDGFHGYVDNVRIMKTANVDYKSYVNFFHNDMEVISPVIDLKYANTEVNQIDFKVKNIDNCVVSLFAKCGNNKDDLLKMDWQKIEIDGQKDDEIIIKGISKIRYLQWKIVMNRNNLSQEMPILYFFSIKYNENIPPLAPDNVVIKPLDSASIKLSWKQNSEDNVTGYIIYWGSESKSYENKLDIGLKNSYIIDSLQANKNYYFAIKAYNNKDPYNLSVFSKEVSIFLK